jgi:hypothetical protein
MRPQGLKPTLIMKPLRGAEAPLFHKSHHTFQTFSANCFAAPAVNAEGAALQTKSYKLSFAFLSHKIRNPSSVKNSSTC